MAFPRGFFWGGATAANQCEGAWDVEDCQPDEGNISQICEKVMPTSVRNFAVAKMVDKTVVSGMLARVYQVMGNWDGAYAEANKAYSAYNTLMSKEEWTSGMDHLMADGCAELIWGVKYTNVSNVGSNTVFRMTCGD